MVHQLMSIPDPPQATSVVLRLSWASRHNGALLSPSLLRDHFLHTPIPPPSTIVPFLLLDTISLTLDIISVHPLPTPDHPPPIVVPTTLFHLLPPIPPRLLPQNSLPTTPTTPDISLAHLLSLALQPSPSAASLTKSAFPLPKSLLVPANFSVDIARHVATHTHATAARLLYLPATAILRTSLTPDGLLSSLRAHIAAAIVSAPAVLLLSDAQLLFPPDDHPAAAAFALACRQLPACHHVVLVVTCAPGPDAVHPFLRRLADVVLPVFADDVHEDVSPHVHRFDAQQGRQELPEMKRARLTSQWDAIRTQLGGLAEPRRVLKTVLLWRQTRSATYQRLGVKPSVGVLLYGCPGTGKTALCREAAAAAEFSMLSVDAAKLARGEVGASERLLRDNFARANRSRPCVLFMDEIDALFSAGRMGGAPLTRLIAALSLLMDRVGDDVVVVAATNRPWDVSKALLRPGRFEHCVLVPLPDRQARTEIAEVYAGKLLLEGRERSCLVQLAADEAAEGFSGADIAGACRRAAMSALCREARIEKCDLEKGFRAVTASVSKSDVVRLESWQPSA